MVVNGESFFDVGGCGSGSSSGSSGGGGEEWQVEGGGVLVLSCRNADGTHGREQERAECSLQVRVERATHGG